jgi:hypothetical protein
MPQLRKGHRAVPFGKRSAGADRKKHRIDGVRVFSRIGFDSATNSLRLRPATPGLLDRRSTGIPQKSATFGNDAKARAGSGLYLLSVDEVDDGDRASTACPKSRSYCVEDFVKPAACREPQLRAGW